MLNQTVLIGRITHEPELKETDNGTKVANITLAVPRGYKNQNGEYDTDFISCSLWRGIAENTVNYVKKGDLIGLKVSRLRLYRQSRRRTQVHTLLCVQYFGGCIVRIYSLCEFAEALRQRRMYRIYGAHYL